MDVVFWLWSDTDRKNEEAQFFKCVNGLKLKLLLETKNSSIILKMLLEMLLKALSMIYCLQTVSNEEDARSEGTHLDDNSND